MLTKGGGMLKIKHCTLHMAIAFFLSALCLLLPGIAFAAQSVTLGGGTKGTGPVGYWNFDESGGPTAYDQSGNGNNGTLHATPAGSNTTASQMWTPSGKFGGALEFDGTNDYVDYGNGTGISTLGVGSFTLEAWVKTSASQGDQGIFQKLGGTGTIRLRTSSAGNNVFFEIIGVSGGIYDVAAGMDIRDGQWHHIVGVRDYGVKARIYIDGVFKDDGNDVAGDATAIGNLQSGITSWGWWNGLIDEVRIYERALTLGEIQKHYVEGLVKHQNLVLK